MKTNASTHQSDIVTSQNDEIRTNSDNFYDEENKKLHTIQLRISEVDEVLSQPPSWLVRWGITVFFFVFLMLIAVGWFVKYPDLIKAKLEIVSVNFPKAVNSKVGGVVVKLFVRDGSKVQKGQFLAFLESTANQQEVLRLDSAIIKLVKLGQKFDLEGIHSVKIPLCFQLGELQKPYQIFQEAYVRSRAILPGSTYSQKKKALKDDLSQLEVLHKNLEMQHDNYVKDYQLANADLEMNSKLHEEKIIASVELRHTTSQYLLKKQSVDQSRTALNNNTIQKNQKFQELIELEKTRSEQLSGLFQSINTLKSDIEAWKQQYVSVAATNGTVSFPSPLQEGQTVKSGQELFYIINDQVGLEGDMYVGQYNFGKVILGQEVIVKFAGYPYQQFGTVYGRIKSISDIPKDTTYMVKVHFPKGLLTSSGKQISFRNGMIASGEIVTEDMKLLERIFYDIRKSFIR